MTNVVVVAAIFVRNVVLSLLAATIVGLRMVVFGRNVWFKVVWVIVSGQPQSSIEMSSNP